MSKSPNTRKKSPRPAKTARHTATSGQGRDQSRHRGSGAHCRVLTTIRNGTKQAMLVDLLGGASGATVPEMAAKAGWQPHSVRGFLSGTLKKKLGLALASQTVDGRGRVYRIAKGR
jgi:hypothetical protein